MPIERNKDRKVVDLTGFACAARLQPLREVEAYWQAARAGRLVPRRSDMDPHGLRAALEHTFVLERIATGLGRVRIAGSQLTALMGMEIRGMPLSAIITAETRAQMAATLEEVFSAPATAELDLRAQSGIGKPHLSARMILLPLKSDLGDISRVLGCLVTHGAVGRAPRRFEIAGRHVVPLLGGTRPPAERSVRERPVAAPAPAAGGMAEETAAFDPGPRPYLRIVRTRVPD
ncbi:hypothetical protein OB2597_03242 [Pseudooceanicola batsensis HTCC2597]|uniref:PAS domain-containing protein n=1 Tax=Pseudooceanicola batsensis (strain ATCC BAA-863 / DSM 15984 / KCTC 12145 / HTCC2597) TaxID=252305 RepID=A3TXP2_PSEBH|nr:PAS domain-containing protein [Pseudooceanicola batsensis]EAQ03602.1 hypothetical protein OB2597_03242 [Pseudooceanicola batsensis HTCC2597]